MSAEDCRKFEEDMVAYLDGELAREPARELEEHLEKCSACAEGLEGFRSARASLRAVPRLKVTDAFRSALGEKLASLHFEERVRAPERSWFRQKIVYFAPSFAACAAFLFVAHFWVIDYVRGDDGIQVVGKGESRRQMLLEVPAEAIFESMITGSELDVSKWLGDGALYLRGHDDVYSADRCIFAFLPADWGAQRDKCGGVRVIVENGRFRVPEDMRAHYLDGANRVTVLRHAVQRLRKVRHSEIWNTERLRRFLSTPVDIHIRAGSSS